MQWTVNNSEQTILQTFGLAFLSAWLFQNQIHEFWRSFCSLDTNRQKVQILTNGKVQTHKPCVATTCFTWKRVSLEITSYSGQQKAGLDMNTRLMNLQQQGPSIAVAHCCMVCFAKLKLFMACKKSGCREASILYCQVWTGWPWKQKERENQRAISLALLTEPNTETPVKVNEPILVQADPWPWTN